MEHEVQNMVEVGEHTFENFMDNFDIEVIEEKDGVKEVFISNINEEDFEDFANELSVYHEEPNEYWELLKHNWHTNKTIYITLFDDSLPEILSF